MSIKSIIICIDINCAGIEADRDSDCCVVALLLLAGAGTALFGFIQALVSILLLN